MGKHTVYRNYITHETKEPRKQSWREPIFSIDHTYADVRKRPSAMERSSVPWAFGVFLSIWADPLDENDDNRWNHFQIMDRTSSRELYPKLKSRLVGEFRWWCGMSLGPLFGLCDGLNQPWFVVCFCCMWVSVILNLMMEVYAVMYDFPRIFNRNCPI